MISYSKDILIASYFHCKITGNNISLLPIDHARAFPLDFDVENKQVINGEINFYNQPFHTNFKINNFIDPLKCKLTTSEKSSNDLIIYNVLDNCFGHAFLKLLLAIQENASSSQNGLLIVPASLAHFVKKGVFAHTIEISYSLKEFESCWILNKLLDPFIEMGYTLRLFPIHTYGTFDKDLLFTGLNVPKPKADVEKKRICFYYRKDEARMWGGRDQKENIIALFADIRKFFSDTIRFTVIGSKDDSSFPAWIEDERVNSFSAENDTLESELLAESLIVISITGSHMLMPSLLSTLTVHLHPVYKYKNMAEDVVSCTQENSKLRSYQHVFYYGNSDCSDILPEKLAYMILLHFQGLTEKTYKQRIEIEKGQKEWIAEQFPYLRYSELNTYRSLVNNNKDPLKRIISKIRSIFSS